MATWEQVLLGVGGLLLVFFFWPGIKATMEQSRQVENPDWGSLFVPIAAVVVFIVLLVMVARS